VSTALLAGQHKHALLHKERKASRRLGPINAEDLPIVGVADPTFAFHPKPERI
jgi:hypothetical protein